MGSESAMKIVVDRNKCSALGICESLAPELFEVQEDGSLTILDERPGEDMRAAAEAAVEGCPTEALAIIDQQ
jgi:ferredoxin